MGLLSFLVAVLRTEAIMQQKVNPDVLELIRGKTARVVGNLQTLLVLVKGLPLAYNRDLQEDKLPVFDSFDTVKASLELAAPLVAAAELNRRAIAERSGTVDRPLNSRTVACKSDGTPDRRTLYRLPVCRSQAT